MPFQPAPPASPAPSPDTPRRAPPIGATQQPAPVPPPPPGPLILPPDALPPVTLTGMHWRALDHLVNRTPTSTKGQDVQPARIMRFDQAFTADHPEDLYATMYGVAPASAPPPPGTQLAHLGAEQGYRLTTSAPAALAGPDGILQSRDQVMGWGIIVEADLKDLYAREVGIDARAVGKVPWTQEWREKAAEGLASVAEACPLLGQPTLFFTSRNGFRLVYCYTRPIPILGIDGHLDRLRGFMVHSYLAGLPLDLATKDWTRIQRLPMVMRQDDDGTTERTRDAEYLRMSWGRVDLTARELDPPPQILAHPPEAFEPIHGMRLHQEYAAHPEWPAIAKLGLAGEHALEGTHRVVGDFGSMPSDEECQRLLTGGQRANGKSVLLAKIHERITRAARRTAKGDTYAAAAAAVADVIFQGRRVDLNPDGSSALHDNLYRLCGDLCWLVIDELGVGSGLVGPDMLYALLIGPARLANEAREGDAGQRDEMTLTDEVWRICTDVFSKRLGKRLFVEEEQRAEQEQLEQDRAAIGAGGSPLFRQLIGDQFKEWLGIDDHWVAENLQHHLIILTSLGNTVVQVKDGAVRLSDPRKTWAEFSSMVRDCGHDLVRHKELPEEPGAPEKVRSFTDVAEDYSISIGDMVRASRLIDRSCLECLREGGEDRIRYVHKLPGVAEDVEPLYHNVADEYLRLIGGEAYEKLLDWLACFTRIDQPLPALYIDGPSGCGKGLFIEMCRHLTSRKEVAEFSDAMSQFQDHYRDTFLVAVDEGTSGDTYQKDVVEVLRRMIGGNFRQINFKGVKGINLDGEWRLVLAANNANILDIRKDLSQQDVEALTGRIFYHWISPADGDRLLDYFDRLGGRYGDPKRGLPGTYAMNLPLLLAQHVMWLVENRQVEHGSRYLIDPPPSPWHDSIRTNSSGGKEFCKIINEIMVSMRDGSPMTGCGVIIHHRVTAPQHSLCISLSHFEKWINTNYPNRIRYDLSRLVDRLSLDRRFRPRLEGLDAETYGKQPRVCRMDPTAILTTLDESGYDCDWRSVIGEAMWQAVAPEDLKLTMQDTGGEDEQSRVIPFRKPAVPYQSPQPSPQQPQQPVMAGPSNDPPLRRQVMGEAPHE